MSGPTEKHIYKAVSLFTGAGGLDIGFEQAGFESVSAIELSIPFCDTIKRNQAKRISIPGTERFYFQGTHIINGDISETSADELNPHGVDIDCLIGGPPCQAFSSAGKQDSIFDRRGTLVYEYLRKLREIRPKVFLFENVRGLVTARGNNGEPGEVLMNIINMMSSMGYHCRAALLNSADYGSYQRRVRCFIIGSRIGAAPEFPRPTHGEKPGNATLLQNVTRPWNTLGDFLENHSDAEIANWVRPTETLAKELASLPEGSGLKSAGRVEATRPSGHWGYRQGTFIADKRKPARTVTGSSSQDWIRMEDGTLRRITMKEAALLQGFPYEWEFCGSKANRFQQIGNAVPVIFGKVLGEVLYDCLENQASNQTQEPSAEMPCDISPKILESIRYTIYDNRKNGAYRVNRIEKFRKQS